MKRFVSAGLIATLVFSLFSLVGFSGAAAASPISGSAFGSTWARTDLPVAGGAVSRTWMWGPHADTGPLLEPYVESPGGERLVQYFDKSRMELTHPNGNPNSIWYVTNGLLAEELITGRMQLGDNTFKQYAPAVVNVAGDLNDPNGPTYATFNKLMADRAIPNGWLITQTVNRAGQIGDDSALSANNVKALNLGVPTHHDVASVFWNFMTSSGLVYQNGQDVQGALFPNAFYATGYPLTEAYWTTVLVAGESTRVLVQVFERRVMTYTPSNPAGWKVESGNVGLDYYQWRYVQLGLKPVADPNPPAPWNPPGATTSPSPPPSASGPASTFGDGTYTVGSDIAAGTYRNSNSSAGCYWARLSGFSGSDSDIIANNFTLATQIVTISPSDAGFSSSGCGTWTPDSASGPAITSSPTAPFGDGTYRVNRDLAPGTWKNSDSSSGCYWARLSGFDGTDSEIIANNFDTTPQVVTLDQSDAGFTTEGCGTWSLVTASAPHTPPVSSGPPANGNIQVSASVSNPDPADYSHETVDGTFTDNGQPVSGVQMDTTWLYRTTQSSCTGTTDSNGVASCTRYISDATIGYTVDTDVSFSWQGKTYTTTTSFTPQ